ncbi:MAG: hypothetical protein ACE15F_16030 [bacterium]
MVRQFLRGKVVSILDDQRLIVNLGLEQGVAMGDRFVVYEEGGEITDPSTQQTLGKLELIKTQVEAVHVQEKMSLLMPILKQTTTQSTSHFIVVQTSCLHKIWLQAGCLHHNI